MEEGCKKAPREMEYGLTTSKPSDQAAAALLSTGLPHSLAFSRSEVSTRAHSERAPASTSDSSFSSPWELSVSQMMDSSAAVMAACPFCDGTGCLSLQ